jgi:branched-chain amino acid transport system ATP-binding protein
MSVLAISGLRKAFGALVVTDDVSLTVEPGEIHALIGPNGAGKTTLIAQISGALAPDAGSVAFNGADVTAFDEAARARAGLARTFQITSVFHGLTALENVRLALQAVARGPIAFRRPEMAERAQAALARDALEEVGLGARLHTPADALAHGEQRGLEVAMALVQRPKLLLLDEPMAGAGREETDRLTALLARLRGRIPMLLVEHDMAAVFALADRVSVLVQGRIVASGAPEAIRRDPMVREAYLGADAEVA